MGDKRRRHKKVKSKRGKVARETRISKVGSIVQSDSPSTSDVSATASSSSSSSDKSDASCSQTVHDGRDDVPASMLPTPPPTPSPTRPADSQKQKVPKKKVKPVTHALRGNRIVNLDIFSRQIHRVITHNKHCPSRPKGIPILKTEVKRKGFASTLLYVCSACNKKLLVEMQPKIKGPNRRMRHQVNMQAVWGFMSVGDGYANMNEVMSVMGIPSPSERTFIDTEHTIGEIWRKELASEILAAGVQEKEMAEAMGQYDEGGPV
ncbi:hypothetical protein Bbelb_344280 [Branchiostoma belcheri]|nr:hypothetical protein Bbelb_344280 [Branchiostoma belcheri]